MAKAYKGATVLYFIFGILGGVFLVFADFLGKGLLFALLWVLVSWLVYAVLLGLLDNRKVQLIQNCKPSAFLAHAEKVYPQITDKNYKNTYRINLFTACHDLGLYEKAVEYLLQVDTNFPDTMGGKLTAHAYHLNMCQHYMDIADYALAQSELEAAEALLASDKLYSATKDSLFKLNQAQRYECNIRQGNYADAELFFSAFFTTEKTLRGKVVAKLILARCFLQSGKTEAAQEACHYVIENGGETHFVPQAQAILARLCPADPASPSL